MREFAWNHFGGISQHDYSRLKARNVWICRLEERIATLLVAGVRNVAWVAGALVLLSVMLAAAVQDL